MSILKNRTGGREMMVLITGGAGFVGSNYIRHAIQKYPDWKIINLDKLTYAGNLENLKDIENNPRYQFIKGDIADPKLINRLFNQKINLVINFAAETHVDRSIIDPAPFIETNAKGTFVLLDGANKFGVAKFIHISTPEVYGGKVQPHQLFNEESPFSPTNPYSASKAAGDLLCRAYYYTHGLNISLTRFANAYGPYQYPEKLLPLTITRALKDEPIPIYGKGQYKRNWIYISDICHAIDLIIDKGRPGEAYNIGSGHERSNLDLVHKVLDILRKPRTLVKFTPDRPAHDWQYPLDSNKIMTELGWQLTANFDEALEKTIQWYQQNEAWWKKLGVIDYAVYYGKIRASKQRH